MGEAAVVVPQHGIRGEQGWCIGSHWLSVEERNVILQLSCTGKMPQPFNYSKV